MPLVGSSRSLCVLLIAVKLAHRIFAGVFMEPRRITGCGASIQRYLPRPSAAQCWLLGLSSALFGWSKLGTARAALLTFVLDRVGAVADRAGGLAAMARPFLATLLLFLAMLCDPW